MRKIILGVGLAGLLLITGGGCSAPAEPAVENQADTSATVVDSNLAAQSATAATLETYTDAERGFSVQYPKGLQTRSADKLSNAPIYQDGVFAMAFDNSYYAADENLNAVVMVVAQTKCAGMGLYGEEKQSMSRFSGQTRALSLPKKLVVDGKDFYLRYSEDATDDALSQMYNYLAKDKNEETCHSIRLVFLADDPAVFEETVKEYNPEKFEKIFLDTVKSYKVTK